VRTPGLVVLLAAGVGLGCGGRSGVEVPAAPGATGDAGLDPPTPATDVYRVDFPTGALRFAVVSEQADGCTVVGLIFGTRPTPGLDLPPGWSLEMAYRTSPCETTFLFPDGAELATDIRGVVRLAEGGANTVGLCLREVDLVVAFPEGTEDRIQANDVGPTGIDCR